MKNYTLQRFVKLSLYFFGMYALLTGAWFGISGRFGEDATGAINEILVNSAIFSLLFTIALLVWYRRTEIRIPVKNISPKALDQKLEEIGYERIPGKEKGAVQVYKPRPPKAPALAGRLFVQKSANFYHLQGPVSKLKSLKV
ncbi:MULTISPECIES: hypothetical protein [Pontibacter]|uniref:Uncharacterized protein n=1 Tax=Pontibacter lucknowensis TaxID=1077936 RepID=A0A1N6W949_9BACT|nr:MULTISPECIES: hypothetical protein [Pontibacter]EJF09879.1 hypothetical protein O71_12523 [Pontibacter sp. BAB1700]SIQ86568.1 hypothetical protein SAMN05421545_1419 [Pontibacter lucknowensis]